MRQLNHRFLSARISLQRMFVLFTLTCIMAAAIAQYPDEVVGSAQALWKATWIVVRHAAFAAALLGPSVMLGGWIVRKSRKPRLAFFASISGVCMGVFQSRGLSHALMGSMMMPFSSPWRWSRLHQIGFFDLCLPPLFVLLIGGISLYVTGVAEVNSAASVRPVPRQEQTQNEQ